jgi:hypothetical protein
MSQSVTGAAASAISPDRCDFEHDSCPLEHFGTGCRRLVAHDFKRFGLDPASES